MMLLRRPLAGGIRNTSRRWLKLETCSSILEPPSSKVPSTPEELLKEKEESAGHWSQITWYPVIACSAGAVLSYVGFWVLMKVIYIGMDGEEVVVAAKKEARKHDPLKDRVRDA
eukprot:TRINITY_DN5561_c0_g1_i1.p2 TRINITY_DN5561_c0_g1~~TRINITY_DN5561_c0_g1_i1.p2  ORF type:complete len:114 (+),score=30.60 TRINITY_DN5561_c0_g1_i1:44-385(+)